jgi:hypothetical protein
MLDEQASCHRNSLIALKYDLKKEREASLMRLVPSLLYACVSAIFIAHYVGAIPLWQLWKERGTSLKMFLR